MIEWTLTRVWEIDNRLVVARTIEDAIELIKTYYKDDHFYEPREIRCVSAGQYPADYDALIKKQE